MLKETIEFEDLDGKKVSETFYFHISIAQISEWALTHDGDMAQHLQTIVDTTDKKELFRLFREIVVMAIGRESEDRRRFIKSPEIVDNFMQSAAYDEFFMKLMTVPNYGSDFINGIMPKNLPKSVAALTDATAEAPKKELSSYTHAQLLEISEDEFYGLIREHRQGNNVPQELLVASFARRDARHAS